jgi:2-polyprenyl-6-methoxyphenol hydroxylase-like FAD-dependent oxidoreductase
MVQAQNDHQEPPSVLIVGAGLGGLLLAILFERSNIPYHIFERAAQVRPLGMHMYTTDLGPSRLAVKRSNISRTDKRWAFGAKSTR